MSSFKKLLNHFARKNILSTHRKMGGGFLHKNIRVEENAGLRENSYLTWFENRVNVYLFILSGILMDLISLRLLAF